MAGSAGGLGRIRAKTERRGQGNSAHGAEAPAGSGVGAEIAAERVGLLTGECPPKGKWVPSDGLLREFCYKHLRVARNCGPQTTDEIIRWAALRGIVLEPPLHDGKSLSATWQDIVARSSTAEFTRVEIVEVLERSIRRKNTRIPIAYQDMLVRLLKASDG